MCSTYGEFGFFNTEVTMHLARIAAMLVATVLLGGANPALSNGAETSVATGTENVAGCRMCDDSGEGPSGGHSFVGGMWPACEAGMDC